MSTQRATRSAEPAPARGQATPSGPGQSPLRQALRGASFADGAAMLAPPAAEPLGAPAAAQPGPKTFPELFAPDGKGLVGYETSIKDPQAVVTGMVVHADCLGCPDYTEGTYVGEGVRDEQTKEIHIGGALGRIRVDYVYSQANAGANALHVRTKAVGQGPDRTQELLLDASTARLVEMANAWRNSNFLVPSKIELSG